MSSAQMSARVNGAQWVGRGIAPDKRIVFNRKGTYRQGGVASIVDAPGEAVYGVIWDVPQNELDKLDKIENPEAYESIALEIHGEEGAIYNCLAYRTFPQGIFDPDPEYLDLIIQSAKDARLPEDYISKLQALRPLTQTPTNTLNRRR